MQMCRMLKAPQPIQAYQNNGYSAYNAEGKHKFYVNSQNVVILMQVSGCV